VSVKTMFRSRKALVLLCLALAILIGGGVWWRIGSSRTTTAYRTTKTTRGEIMSTVTSSGTINAVVSVSVGAAVSGTIKQIFVDYNSLVKKGQVIAQIDPAPFRALVEQSRGNYLNAVANVAKAKVTLSDANRTMKRYASLVKDGSVAVSDYDTYATAAQSAKAALAAAEGTVAQAKGSYDQAKTNLDYATIRSPVDGIVISRAVDAGQTVAASYQTPTLFTIAQDLTKMQILATVDESDIGRIHEGGNATFTVDAYPDSSFSGVVTQVRNAATTVSNVVTYTVVVGVDNPDLRLKPGMTANVTFVTAKKDDALKIPTAALRYRPSGVAAQKTTKAQPGQKRIYVLKNGRPEPVPITVGIGNDKETEVSGGELAEGAEVVVEEQTGVKVSGSSNPFGARGPGMGPPPR